MTTKATARSSRELPAQYLPVRSGLPRGTPWRQPGARLFEPTLTCENLTVRQTVGVLRRYSNRPDLLEQLREVSGVVFAGGLAREVQPSRAAEESNRSRSRLLRDRFSAEELQAMIDLYRSGTLARIVAERYGVGVRSVRRLLHARGVCRRATAKSA